MNAEKGKITIKNEKNNGREKGEILSLNTLFLFAKN